MSQDLINALTTYYSKIEDYQTITTSFTYVIYENRVQKTVYVNDISFERLLNKIDSVSELYNKYKVAYDQYTATDEALNSLIHEHSQEERTTKEEEFKVKRNAYEEQIASIMLSVGLAELDPDTGDISYDEQDLEDAYHSAQSKYNAYLLAISNIQNSLKYENVKDGNDNNIFSNELLNELNEFIYEGEYKVDSISNPQTLYLYGVQYLEYLTEPSIEITSNLIDIFDNDNMCKYWKRFNNIGDYAIIDYSDAGYEYQSFRMSELTHTISSNDTSLKISLTNKEELSTELKDIINNVWFYAYKTARDFNKYKTTWEKYSQKIQDAISEGQKISAEMNNIINKTGATVADSGGITASRQDGNSLFTANDGIYCKTSNFATVNPSTGDIEVKEKRGTVIINGATYTDDEDNDLMTININGENGSAGYIQDTLMSNLRLYVLKPEITISNNTVIWSGGDTHTWAFASTDISVSNIRLYTVIDKDSIEVKEEHLIMSVRSGIVETNVRNLTIDGKQVYWTEIRTTANEQHPYEYLTFVPPTNTSLIEMYKVKIPAVVNGNQSYTKLRIEGIYNSSEDTNEMKFTFGAGDNNGNNQMKIIKETYSGRMIYTDTNGQEYGVKLSYDLGENTHRVRQITAGVETDIYPQIVVSDLDDAADMPDNSIIFLREESE